MYKNTGFTLIELLIALTLSASIMLILASGMQVVLRDWERSSSRLDQSLDQVLVLLQLERALDAAYPHSYLDDDTKQQVIFFLGERENLAWVSLSSPGRSGGLMAWQINVGKDGVEIRTSPAFADNPLERLEDLEQPLVSFTDYDLNLEYFYLDEQFNGRDSKWLDEWSGEDRRSLPNAVRIVLEHSKDSDQSLEIIANIKAFEHANLPRINP
jgi:prepilin-type N-terminal cleavage/methylation domain-containing protein